MYGEFKWSCLRWGPCLRTHHESVATGDEAGGCCHNKKPSPWPPIITCIILLIPRLMEAIPSFTSLGLGFSMIDLAMRKVPQWLRQQGEFNQICLNLGRLTLRAPDFQRFQFFDCCFPRPREFGDRLSRHRPDANHVTPLCSTVDVVPTWTFRVQNQGANGASVKRILHPRSPKTSTSMQ